MLFRSPRSFCQVFDYAYEQTNGEKIEIKLWSAGTNTKEKDGIAALNSVIKPPVYASETDEFGVSVDFVIQPKTATIEKGDINEDGKFDLTDVALHLDDAVSPPVALHLVGCKEHGLKHAEKYYDENKNDNVDRRLESESKLAAIRNWACGEYDETYTSFIIHFLSNCFSS